MLDEHESEIVDKTTLATRPVSLNRKLTETLELLDRELTSKEIARELGIAPVTVDQRVKKLRELFGVADRAALLDAYRRHNADHSQTIYGSTMVDSHSSDGVRNASELPSSAIFSVQDSMGNFPPNPDNLSWSALEAFDRKFGRWGRVGLIVVFAVGIAMLLMLGLGIASALSEIV